MGYWLEMGVWVYKCGNIDIVCMVLKVLDFLEFKCLKKELEEVCGYFVDIFNKLNVCVFEKLEVGGSSICLYNNCMFILY